MEKTLADKIREQRKSIYKITAKKFNTNYTYVHMIAGERRTCIRGKAKAIKEYLEKHLKNK